MGETSKTSKYTFECSRAVDRIGSGLEVASVIRWLGLRSVRQYVTLHIDIWDKYF